MDDPSDAPSLAAFVRLEWLPSMRGRLKASTWDSYRRNMDLHVLPRLGDRLVADLNARDLNRLYGLLLADGKRNGPGGLSAKTVRYIHTIIHVALTDAVDLGIASENAATRAKPPRVVKQASDLQVWSGPELRRFLRSIQGDPLYPAFYLAAMTGMRRGEVLGLRWSDLDLERRSLVVRHTLISVAYHVQESTPKTHRPRMVELDASTALVLRHHRESVQRPSSIPRDELVFKGADGRRVHPDSFTQRFDRLVAKSGLPRMRLHDLRHTHATLGLAAGVPVRVMSERLGHASPEFT